MAKRKINRAKEKQVNKLTGRIRHEMIGILVVGFSCFGMVALFSDQSGVLGAKIREGLSILAGGGRFLVPVMLGAWGIAYLNHSQRRLSWRIAGALILWLVLLGLLHLQLPGLAGMDRSQILAEGKAGHGGGVVGGAFAYLLNSAVGMTGSYVLLLMGAIIGAVLLLNHSFVEGLKEFKEIGAQGGHWLSDRGKEFAAVWKSPAREPLPEEKEGEGPRVKGRKGSSRPDEEGAEGKNGRGRKRPAAKDKKADGGLAENPPADQPLSENIVTDRPLVIHTHIDRIDPEGEKEGYKDGELNTDVARGIEIPAGQLAFQNMGEKAPVPRQVRSEGGYTLPSTALLHKALHVKNPRLNKDLTDNVRTLEETLESFGVRVKVTHVTQGPTITRYEAQPAPGVKVSKITNLADDIALSLAASGVRIEAPVPGKSVVGIEVPNKEVATVHFREVIESPDFVNFSGKLGLALGKDISGTPVITDLAKMPHLLIAGATGSGKSVCINTLIQSILFKATPDEVKFLLVDPKMVELANYNGIPHLIAPVVTDPKKAAGALKWIVTEMETRYELFAASGVRDIVRYNYLCSQKSDKEQEKESRTPLPYVVVIIDELADLMMVAPGDVEDAICRLAQMARAAGIHLVVATQRPSVDVLTGLIKANIPSRIAFAVSSQVDSRTILDIGGAEKLLGRGDMLFYPMGANKPLRVQGCFLGDKEVDNVVKFLQAQAKPEYQEIPDLAGNTARQEEELDELFYEAAQLFIENNTASVSLLQRRLRIGYTRAARLMDLLEEKGVVGPYEGSKPREVLLTPGQFETKFGRWDKAVN